MSVEDPIVPADPVCNGISSDHSTSRKVTAGFAAHQFGIPSALRHLFAAVAWLLPLSGAISQPTPLEDAAAFARAATLANRSYHWDSLSPEGLPQVATTERFPLAGTTLSTISWDGSATEFYQMKTIDSVAVPCTLVVTFAFPFETWTAPAGTVTELSFSQAGTPAFIMPYVTWGDDLHAYLRSTYFSTAVVPSPAEAQRRIQQALGMPSTSTETHGLAFFWAPLAQVARPAYSADVAEQLPVPLTAYPDGSFQAIAESGPPSFVYRDTADATKTYDSLADFVEWNQAQTSFPWTAMGTTFNWNSLQDGSDPALGFDPLAPASSFGVSEFIVSAGSKIVNDRFVPYEDLGVWVVPEPSTFVLVVIGIAGACCYALRRNYPDNS